MSGDCVLSFWKLHRNFMGEKRHVLLFPPHVQHGPGKILSHFDWMQTRMPFIGPCSTARCAPAPPGWPARARGANTGPQPLVAHQANCGGVEWMESAASGKQGRGRAGTQTRRQARRQARERADRRGCGGDGAQHQAGRAGTCGLKAAVAHEAGQSRRLSRSGVENGLSSSATRSASAPA